LSNENDARFRLRELHALLVSEIDRNAHDCAVRVLKQIGKEAAAARITNDPIAVSADLDIRLTFWRTLYDRAKSRRAFEQELEILEHMRREDATRVSA
jgi:hypothetical protein